jgi:hypothetical protein
MPWLGEVLSIQQSGSLFMVKGSPNWSHILGVRCLTDNIILAFPPTHHRMMAWRSYENYFVGKLSIFKLGFAKKKSL